MSLLEKQRELRVKVTALKNIAKVLQRLLPLFPVSFLLPANELLLAATDSECEDVRRGDPDSTKGNGRIRRGTEVIARYSRLLRQTDG